MTHSPTVHEHMLRDGGRPEFSVVLISDSTKVVFLTKPLILTKTYFSHNVCVVVLMYTYGIYNFNTFELAQINLYETLLQKCAHER